MRTIIFENDPFIMLGIAFKRLYPDIDYKAYYEANLQDDEGGEAFGMTDFSGDGKITIYINPGRTVNEAVEIFAHELAHAAAGLEHSHDEVWQKAFDDLFETYNKLGEEMFGRRLENLPSSSDYAEALQAIGENS